MTGIHVSFFGENILWRREGNTPSYNLWLEVENDM